MSQQLVFAGDLHASRAIYASHPNMVGDSKFAFEQITDYCRERDAHLVLLGDNFDKRFPPAEVLEWFLKCIVDLDVTFIQGQHDMQAPVAWLQVEGNPGRVRCHLDGREECVEVAGVKLWGFDWKPRAKVEELLREVPADCDVLCMHQMLNDVMGLTDGWNLSMEWVPEHVKLTMLGDWHGLPQEGDVDGKQWAYTGSSSQRSVSEPTRKSFITIASAVAPTELHAGRSSGGGVLGGVLPYGRQVLKTRPFLLNEVRWETELKEWCSNIVGAATQRYENAKADGVPDEVARPFVALRYNVGLDGAYEDIMDAIGSSVEKGLLYFHPLPNRKYVTESDTDELSGSVNVEDAVNELVDREICPELYRLVTDLAVSADPKDVIHAYKHRHEITDDPTS